MIASRTTLLSLALLGLAASPAAGQDSQFGIRGLGTPGRWESVRARTTGGAFGPFDPGSPLLAAALADLGRLTATASGAASYRRVEAGGTAASLRTPRFPVMALGGPVGGRLVVGGGFSSYLDRTFRVVTQGTIDIRGAPEPYTDEIASDGGISDLRLAAALRVIPRLAVGFALHVLTGSTRMTATRIFADSSDYRNSGETTVVRYDGLGGSASVIADVASGLRLAGYLRSDTRLRARLGGEDTETSRHDLPLTVGGGLRWQPTASARLAAAGEWRFWAGAGAGVDAHDTFGWSAGAELGREALPLRLGVRGGRLPFGPGARAPTEFGAAVGTGFRFSEGRGLIDVGVERLERRGSGLRERVWTFLFGVTVRP